MNEHKERHMIMSDWEKKQFRAKIKPPIIPRNEQPVRINAGRGNERYEKAANRRSADIYVQNF